jgi:hypothetical protein
LENNSFFVKLAKNKFALILLVIVLISSIIANGLVTNYILSEFAPSHNIEAIELDDKPTEFIPYIFLEPYGIQEVFDENSSLKISYVVFLEINKLIKNYDTRNVQFGSNYYRLYFSFVDETEGVAPETPWSFLLLPYVTFFIFLISGILIVIILIEKIGSYFVKR